MPGAALEVVPDELIKTSQLAVDTHGQHRLRRGSRPGCSSWISARVFAQGRLFLPRGTVVPDALAEVCLASDHDDAAALRQFVGLIQEQFAEALGINFDRAELGTDPRHP